MSINEVRWLSECGSTNAYAKEHFEEFGPVGAVYTTNQTAGRGRLGRSWVNAEGRALYYTAVIREPLAQPATLPLLASLAVRDQLAQRYGVDCRIKWPNDLLLNGKKIVGILCESVSYGYQMQGRGIVCGIGINLAQPQSYFDAANLPNGTSLELQGAKVDLAADPQWLAEALTDFGFDRPLYTFAREGFAPFRDEYKAACVNLGRHVTFDLPGGGTGSGTAIDVDADGRLIVRTDSGEEKVFTGEVSVHGIYGAVLFFQHSSASAGRPAPGALFRSCFCKQGAPNGEDFCPQTRRFSAAILTDCKGKQRGMRAKRPLRAVCNAYENGFLFFPCEVCGKLGFSHGFPHMVFAGQRLWKTPAPKIPEGRGTFAPSAKCRRK